MELIRSIMRYPTADIKSHIIYVGIKSMQSLDHYYDIQRELSSASPRSARRHSSCIKIPSSKIAFIASERFPFIAAVPYLDRLDRIISTARAAPAENPMVSRRIAGRTAAIST
jgi:hypothetical protein